MLDAMSVNVELGVILRNVVGHVFYPQLDSRNLVQDSRHDWPAILPDVVDLAPQTLKIWVPSNGISGQILVAVVIRVVPQVDTHSEAQTVRDKAVLLLSIFSSLQG